MPYRPHLLLATAGTLVWIVASSGCLEEDPSFKGAETQGSESGSETTTSSETNGTTTSSSTETSTTTTNGSVTGPMGTCDEIYGEAPGYLLCEENDTECHFNANTLGISTCSEVCTMFGGTCITAFDNVNIELCMAISEDDCETSNQNEICVCSHS